MKERLFVFLGILAVIYLVAGSIAVEYDKDIIRCKAEFESEVNEIEGREFTIQMVAGGNEIYAEEIKDTGEDSPYNGSLDWIIEQRDSILKEKSVLMLGSWWTTPKGGIRESTTLSI